MRNLYLNPILIRKSIGMAAENISSLFNGARVVEHIGSLVIQCATCASAGIMSGLR